MFFAGGHFPGLRIPALPVKYSLRVFPFWVAMLKGAESNAHAIVVTARDTP